MKVEKKEINIYFVWHWQKKTSEKLKGAFSVFDSMMQAIKLLSKNQKYNVKVLCISNVNSGEYYSEEQGLGYFFVKTLEDVAGYLKESKPDYIFLNHHGKDYYELLREVNQISCKKVIYYSSLIRLRDKNLFSSLKNALQNKSPVKEFEKIDFHITHHEYQKKELLAQLKIKEDRIFVAPKTADLEKYKPLNVSKEWDCIYPGRCSEGYLKRPELAIKACEIAGKTLVMPGAKLDNTYEHVTTFDDWIQESELISLYNKSKCLLITTNYREMGPRVIPEAAACNIPIVCCSDSSACVSHVKKIGGFIAEPNVHDIARQINLATKTICNTRDRLIEIGYAYDLIYKTILEILSERCHEK